MSINQPIVPFIPSSDRKARRASTRTWTRTSRRRRRSSSSLTRWRQRSSRAPLKSRRKSRAWCRRRPSLNHIPPPPQRYQIKRILEVFPRCYNLTKSLKQHSPPTKPGRSSNRDSEQKEIDEFEEEERRLLELDQQVRELGGIGPSLF